MPLTIASANGCSDCFSAVPISDKNFTSSSPSATKTSVNTGFPCVTVPVLSTTTVSMPWVCSKCSPPLNNIPNSAERPEPAIMEVGVANPSAHGQAITRTAINTSSACVKSPGWTQMNHARKVRTAIPTTIGTNIPEIRSARRWIGALDPCASSTTLMIWANAVSFPTFIALILMKPFLLIVEPYTASPSILSTGRLSPVSIDSSTAVDPSNTSPSTGIFSPGFTNIVSPMMTSSKGTSFSIPSRRTLAVFA